jgi:hypothetical protein
MKAGWTRKLGWAAAATGVVVAVITVRVVVSSAGELSEAERYRNRGELDAAIVHYRRAARWYAPGNPYCVDALVGLAEIGQEAEQAGEIERALSAFRGIRAAIMSTRSFYTPHGDRLDAANERIADLMASMPPPPIDAGKSREQLRREHLALLTSTHGPHLLWTLVLLLGFFFWVGGAFTFAFRAIDSSDRLIGPEARRWGALVVVGFAMFVLGMLKA